MGEKQNEPFQLSLNASLKVDFQGSRVTSDGGLILVRELDERWGLGDLIGEHLGDARRGKNTQFLLADLFWTWIRPRYRWRYYWLLLAESHLTRRLFRAMVGRIAALPVATLEEGSWCAELEKKEVSGG